MQASVFSHVKIVGFDENMNWGYDACTDCGRETKMENPCPVYESCNRFVPYPDKKFVDPYFLQILELPKQII